MLVEGTWALNYLHCYERRLGGDGTSPKARVHFLHLPLQVIMGYHGVPPQFFSTGCSRHCPRQCWGWDLGDSSRGVGPGMVAVQKGRRPSCQITAHVGHAEGGPAHAVPQHQQLCVGVANIQDQLIRGLWGVGLVESPLATAGPGPTCSSVSGKSIHIPNSFSGIGMSHVLFASLAFPSACFIACQVAEWAAAGWWPPDLKLANGTPALISKLGSLEPTHRRCCSQKLSP